MAALAILDFFEFGIFVQDLAIHLKPMTDERQNRPILSADFVGRQKIGRFLYDTRPIKSAIISAVELGSNFADKIGR